MLRRYADWRDTIALCGAALLVVHTAGLFFPALSAALGPSKRAHIILFLRLSGAEGLFMAPLMSRVRSQCAPQASLPAC